MSIALGKQGMRETKKHTSSFWYFYKKMISTSPPLFHTDACRNGCHNLHKYTRTRRAKMRATDSIPLLDPAGGSMIVSPSSSSGPGAVTLLVALGFFLLPLGGISLFAWAIERRPTALGDQSRRRSTDQIHARESGHVLHHAITQNSLAMAIP